MSDDFLACGSPLLGTNSENNFNEFSPDSVCQTVPKPDDSIPYLEPLNDTCYQTLNKFKENFNMKSKYSASGNDFMESDFNFSNLPAQQNFLRDDNCEKVTPYNENLNKDGYSQPYDSYNVNINNYLISNTNLYYPFSYKPYSNENQYLEPQLNAYACNSPYYNSSSSEYNYCPYYSNSNSYGSSLLINNKYNKDFLETKNSCRNFSSNEKSYFTNDPSFCCSKNYPSKSIYNESNGTQEQEQNRPISSYKSSFIMRCKKDDKYNSCYARHKRSVYLNTKNKRNHEGMSFIESKGDYNIQIKTEIPSPKHSTDGVKVNCKVNTLDCYDGKENSDSHEDESEKVWSSCMYEKNEIKSSLATPEKTKEKELKKGDSDQITTTTLWKQVDDVIDEILNLEEGLEAAGNNLKKCDSQVSDQQSQEESVPGTMTCDILGLHGFMGLKSSSSCPPEVPKVKSEPQSNADPQVVAILKDRQKKDNHNMIERRRRFNINDRIRDLMFLLPKAHERYHENYRDTRHNKGQILTASVSYMRKLKEDVKTQGIMEDKIKALEHDKKLLTLRVKELENQLQANGIKVEEMNLDSNMYTNSFIPTEVLSPISAATSVTSPYTPTPTPTPMTSPFTMNITSTSPMPLTASTGNYTNNLNCNSGGGGSVPCHLSHFTDEHLPLDETSSLLDELVGVGCESSSSSHVKKVKSENVKCSFSDFLLEEMLLEDFDSRDFRLDDIMDGDVRCTLNDPLLSSPQISSPNSSRHSYPEDSMDIGS